jgi:hypothetical protein
MSSAWTKIVVAKLMIEECDYLTSAESGLDLSLASGDKRALEIVAARRAYWEEVHQSASLRYSLEGGS